MVFHKGQLELQLKDEYQQIQTGVLRDESPLDNSPEFWELCQACRKGDLRKCQEAIDTGIEINSRDAFDYTPLILASLCGHYEVVRLLLEAGALCERDTFQGERCLYNALNDRIRNLLLEYDYSKSTDPLQPYSLHITSLLTRQGPNTSDICLTAGSEQWNLHKLILSARSPYFSDKLNSAPDTATWKLAPSIPPESYQIAFRYLYLAGLPTDIELTSKSTESEEAIFEGLVKVSTYLETKSLFDSTSSSSSDRRLARQRQQDEVTRGRNQIETWYKDNVIKYKVHVDSSKAQDVKWPRNNRIFADVLLQADEEDLDEGSAPEDSAEVISSEDPDGVLSGPTILIGPSSDLPSIAKMVKKSVLYPVHRAMLSRSEYFQAMFRSSFKEAQITDHLQIVHMDCTPEVLEIMLNFMYAERSEIPIALALDILYFADMLLMEKLKTKAVVVLCTTGMGSGGGLRDPTHTENGEEQEVEVEPINIYDVMRAAWDLKVQRLETFSARYLAYRLEDYIDEEEFEDMIKESASKITKRQETDSIELVDDIRFYLSERFRLRFEDSGLNDLMDENGEIDATAASTGKLDSEAAHVHEMINEVNDEKNDEVQRVKESDPISNPFMNGEIKTLDGDIAGDEFAADAINYQVLLGKIDKLLDKLKLDA